VAEAARQLIADADMRRRLGAAGAERARRRYGWDTVAEGTLRSYMQVLSRRRGAARRTGVAAGAEQ
jgi:glycosyltransferase involved in cell wall biosynthesis